MIHHHSRSTVHLADRSVYCIRLQNGNQLFYINEGDIQKEIKKRDLQDDPSLQQIKFSDLTDGKYEGGFKVWECVGDLCNYLDLRMEPELIVGADVLEIGCGAALPAIYALQKGAKSVAVQDFNRVVIECFTKPNFELNKVPIECCDFYSGQWDNLTRKMIAQKKRRTFDIILCSEAIYSKTNYPQIHDLIEETLGPDGFALIAAKLYYFGIEGGTNAFMEYVKSRNILDIGICEIVEDELPRRILRVTRKASVTPDSDES